MPPRIHIIALNVPYPANYGGVIDIYWQIHALKALGVKVTLHCWQYGRGEADELSLLCEAVYYYPRRTGLRSNLSPCPYNVESRHDELLLERLMADDAPILYEGLHTTYYIDHPSLRGRTHIVRACNVEHVYYRAIARAERSLLSKLFHHIEALRFGHYERALRRASLILSVSSDEATYFSSHYPEARVELLPCFHPYDRVACEAGMGAYILYHGKLSVPENVEAALYLIREVLAHVPHSAVIAGMAPPECLYDAIAPYPHISIVADPSEEEMASLIRHAQIHLLYTDQPTGLKLKLLTSLMAGRHVVANPTMLVGSSLDELCHIGHSAGELRHLCDRLMSEPFDTEEIERRQRLLAPYLLEQLGRRLVHIVWLQG